ncbi:MAG: 4-hydroxybenzoate octaprenyltransferase [Pseudomonadota bacterium]
MRLIRADKPIGSLLLMWPMLWALWVVSNGSPHPGVLLVFVVGTFLMRSAGCAINDFADRHIDGSVARSSQRPIVTGAVTPTEALITAAVLALCSFALVLTMNRLTVLMSFVGVVLAAVYPFSKRITYWPQLVLGLAFGWAVPMVSSAQTGAVQPVAWVIFGGAILWALAYDTIYAMVDRRDDVKLGVKSTAIWLGNKDVAAVAVTLLAVLALLLLVGIWQGLGLWFFIGWLAGLGVACYQLWLIRDREEAACFKSFNVSNYMGFAIFLGLVVDLSV